jgi:hypothetical protein
MPKRKRIIKYTKSVNVRIYEDCLSITDGDEKEAYNKYKRIMLKIERKASLNSEEEYLKLID